MSLEGFRWRFQQKSQGGVSLSRWLAPLLFGFRHRSDYGTQEGVDSFRRLECRCNARFEENGYNPFRHRQAAEFENARLGATGSSAAACFSRAYR